MNVRYSLGDYTLKVLGCDKSLDVLDFYYRNRNDFDIYESDKPEAFYTEEFIKNMLNAENKALMSLHYVKVFLELTVNKSLIVICVRAFSKCLFFEYFFLLAQFLKEGA